MNSLSIQVRAYLSVGALDEEQLQRCEIVMRQTEVSGQDIHQHCFCKDLKAGGVSSKKLMFQRGVPR